MKILIAFSWNYNSNKPEVPYIGRAIVNGMVRNDLVFNPSTNTFEKQKFDSIPSRLDIFLNSIKKMPDSKNIWLHYDEDGVITKECTWSH